MTVSTDIQPRTTTLHRVIRQAAAVLTLAAVAATVNAQSPVFTRDTLTAGALVNALVPRTSGIRTRAISQQSGSASVLVTFRSNSAEITPQAREELDIIAGALQAKELQPFGFTIEGHADPRGNDDYNLRLSQRRAQSIVAYLSKRRGVAPTRLHAVGKGETEQMIPDRPTAPENRRVTIKTRVE